MSEAVLAEREWQARRRAHRERVRAWTRPHQRRRAAGERHPVLDFLFTYYSHRPAKLERWHPGLGVVLAGDTAEEYLRYAGYVRHRDGVTLEPAVLTPARLRTVTFVRSLLRATAARHPRLNCFGLHEWAMVYRQPAEEVRHAGWPLRLGTAATDAVVERMDVRCSHYDAYRFFTPEAVPRNELRPTRREQVAFEQPGCVHATMDLYKWCYKLDPLLPSELVADCFALAADARELDMRASPYDLSALGYSPVPIETPAGRAEYVRAQQDLARRAEPLRARLLDHCDGLTAP